MCPALMLAASRNDRVRGRTTILVVSINTRNGFNQSGAPSGRRWAIVFLGLYTALDKINLSHIGNPRDRVKIKCLEVLNEYGIIPIRLIITRRMKIDEITDVEPFRCRVLVRDSCPKIVDFSGVSSAVARSVLNQNDS